MCIHIERIVINDEIFCFCTRQSTGQKEILLDVQVACAPINEYIILCSLYF